MVNIQDIDIIADRATNIVIVTPIYPVPMMNVSNEYSTMFNPLANSPFISDKDTVLNDLYMEMADESASHHVVNVEKIVVSKSATIKCNFNATIKLNSLSVKENSNATLHSPYITNNMLTEPNSCIDSPCVAFIIFYH